MAGHARGRTHREPRARRLPAAHAVPSAATDRRGDPRGTKSGPESACACTVPLVSEALRVVQVDGSIAGTEHICRSAASLLSRPASCCRPLASSFRLKKIYEPGTWTPIPEVQKTFPCVPQPGEKGFIPGHETPEKLKGKRFCHLRPNCRLLVVTATYRQPMVGVQESKIGKMFGSVIMLEYADREAYIRGLGPEFSRPIIAMKEEFSRDKRWTDWKGVEYSLKECWDYVNGPARQKDGCTPGIRDDKNDGLHPEEFVQRINTFIKKRRADKEHFKGQLDDKFALLTLDEVLAVRLYSGPAYQPINEFLRQIFKVKGDFRTELVRSPNLTFTATVNHICNAIRKLADVNTEEELEQTLYRCVRGELPNSFWASDHSNAITAVDTAFMSTSRQRSAAEGYMDANAKNVLWTLHPKPQDDSAFHCGASIKLLSQFQAEDEVLFPPCTMIQLLTKHKPHVARGESHEGEKSSTTKLTPDERIKKWKAERMSRFQAENKKGSGVLDGVEWLELAAVPSFV